MLSELHIKNFALIESLSAEFRSGLNVLTGETGAGKSIIVDALGLLLGDKAQATIVRKGSDRCEVTGIFDIEKNKNAKKFLNEISADTDEDSLILRREIDSSGKSKAFLNDRPVSLSTLSSLGDLLIEMHSQHEHQRLLKNSEQRDFLDRFAGAWDLREQISQEYGDWKSLMEQSNAAQMSEQEREHKIDLYSFQVKEIDEAKLKPGEEEEIEKLLPQLKNAEKIRLALGESYDHLYEAEGSVTERLQKVKRSLENLQNFGVELEGGVKLIDDVLVNVSEIVGEIESWKGKVSADPAQLDRFYSRQDLLSKLKKKYGITVEAILQYREKIKQELDALENHAQSRDELNKKIEAAHAKLMKTGRALSKAREKAGEKLASAVEKELRDLGFLKSKFMVSLVAEKDEKGIVIPSSSGLEKVEFNLSANAGEDIQPIRSVASGGELSRIMLALKKILAQVDVVPTLIFDEVDSGIGGSMGHVIGEKLKGLGKTHQVIAITHLPQVAAFAQNHISVRKEISDKRTKTEIAHLEKSARVEEIARMLGGITSEREKPTPASLKHASELIEAAQSK